MPAVVLANVWLSAAIDGHDILRDGTADEGDQCQDDLTLLHDREVFFSAGLESAGVRQRKELCIVKKSCEEYERSVFQAKETLVGLFLPFLFISDLETHGECWTVKYGSDPSDQLRRKSRTTASCHQGHWANTVCFSSFVQQYALRPSPRGTCDMRLDDASQLIPRTMITSDVCPNSKHAAHPSKQILPRGELLLVVWNIAQEQRAEPQN